MNNGTHIELNLELLALCLLLSQEVDSEAAPLGGARLELAPVHVEVAGAEVRQSDNLIICDLCHVVGNRFKY